MIIEEVEMRNIFNCVHKTLSFDRTRRNSVYVVQNNEDRQCPHLLTIAIQLLCSAKYAKCSLCPHSILNAIREGFVRIKFILPVTPDNDSPEATNIESIDDADDEEEEAIDIGPSTSAAAEKRPSESQKRQRHESLLQNYLLIDARRDFQIHPDEVIYTINGGNEERCSLAAFHGRFYMCLDYLLPSLEKLTLDFDGDWLKLLSAELNEKFNQREQLYDDPFEKFMSLYSKYGYPKEHILSKITEAHLSNTTAMETLQKTYVIKILRDTRGMFEFISAGEWTVFFYVPHHGCNADVVFDMYVEDLNFKNMTTYIKDKSNTSIPNYLWFEANPAIRDMLLIAFQISLSFHCKQQITYLNNFEEIANYQAIQFATTACFQTLGFIEPSYTSKNYLQRIVDVCISSGTTVIIEYPGGTPLHPVNAYLMKSFKDDKDGQARWSLKLITDNQTFGSFLESLREAINMTSQD